MPTPLHPPSGADSPGSDTSGDDYTKRLLELQTARWKAVLDVQRPYRWNLGRLGLDRCLDVGCGIGRNLINLGPDSVGVDHNPTSVKICRERGLTAYTAAEFTGGAGLPRSFDSMLLAHLLEHVDVDTGDRLVCDYLPYLRPGARVVFITPQEWGFRSDPTHVRWVDHAVARAHAESAGLVVEKTYSFPFPRIAGRLFIYNEFITVARYSGA